MRRIHEAWRFGALVVCSSLGVSVGASAHAAPPRAGRPVTAAECIAVALRANPDALSSDYDVREAEAARAGARGQYGPKLHADAGLQQWDSPFSINFGGASFTVRDAFTWTASATLTQPLSGLFAIHDRYQEQDFGVDVAAIRREAMRRQVALSVVEQYYRLVEAEELEDVAGSSVAQLEAQEKQAQSLFANGVVAKNDLLRADLALAGARQSAIQRRGQVAIARGRLASAMGVAWREAIEPVRFSGEPPPVDESTVESAEDRAVAQRVELREFDRGIDKEEHALGFAKKLLLPRVDGVANYTHFEGSQFQQKNAAYAGVTASWDVWDWGTTSSGIGEADARLQRARVARRKIEDQVRLEARQAFVDADTAREAFGVARVSLSQAEENYRIVAKKFENNAATSFDVVDAEALLTQARGQIQQALYDYLIARAALKVATGEPMAEEAR
ncbi:MAG TPA: TolC family protein [Polyangiaceae bacterium]|nr:TolC family protein [Polyangiaceae bacterium]